MTDALHQNTVSKWYDAHPINERQILDKLKADGVDLATLSEDTLQNYDQDHYDGVTAIDALAALAEIDEASKVLDVCCGMGGPSRYLAQNYGCHVTGVDLTASRVEGAKELTALAGLEDRVTLQCADALALPFDDGRFDVAISQESFCHIPGKDELIAEVVRVLKPGGRIAFTDILVNDSTTDASMDRLHREVAFFEPGSKEVYSRWLQAAGCEVIAIEDLSDRWRVILVERLAMYRSLKAQTVARFGLEHFEKWDQAYDFFVGLFQTGELGGARFLGRRREE